MGSSGRINRRRVEYGANTPRYERVIELPWYAGKSVLNRVCSESGFIIVLGTFVVLYILRNAIVGRMTGRYISFRTRV